MLTIFSRGSVTINASDPGSFVNQTISIPGMEEQDSVVITCRTSTRDGMGSNQLNAIATTDGFIVTSERPQLARDVDIEFIVSRGTD